jgi:hypothetical protein
MHTLSRRLSGKDTKDDRSTRHTSSEENNFSAAPANGDSGAILHSHPAVPDIQLGDGSEAFEHRVSAEAAHAPAGTNRADAHRAHDDHYHAKQESHRRKYNFGRG